MPEIKFENNAPLSIPSAGGDDWDLLKWIDKIDKVVGNVRGLFSELQTLQGGQSGAQIPALNNGSRASITRDQHFAARETKKAVNEEPERNGQQLDKSAVVKAVLKQHLEKCVAENPEMPILDVLSKTELTANQMLILFSQI